jgi:putative ubiquitin-RnfH superfamily antitoxin RatB of RatAB toxin-antitoxin module
MAADVDGAAKALIQVEVAYARPERQVIVAVQVPAGADVTAAIAGSGLLGRFPEIDLARQKVGIFGRLVELDAPLREGDRVEIYRPLIADPKEVRKQRAQDAKKG